MRAKDCRAHYIESERVAAHGPIAYLQARNIAASASARAVMLEYLYPLRGVVLERYAL